MAFGIGSQPAPEGRLPQLGQTKSVPAAIPINPAALTPVRHADSPLTAPTGPSAELAAQKGSALPKVSFFDD